MFERPGAARFRMDVAQNETFRSEAWENGSRSLEPGPVALLS